MEIFLPKHPENQETCFICGRPGATREHVIPKWLQRRFNLWDQLLSVPNGKSVPYRKLIVPACNKCNSEVYGKLEDRVESGGASEADIWRWANKIHYALGYKDRFYNWDMKNPGVKIGDVLRSDDPLEKDRHFLHTVSGDFSVDPDPFGSVFRFDFSEEQEFTFVHIISSNSICVSLGRVGYVIFVTDGQALKRDTGTIENYARLPNKIRKEDMLFFYAQCIEHLARHELGQNILMSKGKIIRIGSTVVHAEHPINPERFRAVCKALGLKWVNNQPSSLSEGKQIVLETLKEMGIEVTDSDLKVITECDDIERIKRWINLLPNTSLAETLLKNH